MKIHILGIVGNLSAPLALELKRLGHDVSGCDQDKIYPPFSTELEKAGILVNTPLSSDTDLVIVGASYKAFSRCRDAYQQALDLGIPTISATVYLSQNLVKPNSITVAGSYGKTTITSLLTWILTNAGYDPSYMFGGQSLNEIKSLSINNSPWSVIEGDESINGLDTKAKFLYYPTKYAVITSTLWEHKDSYASAADNLLAFQNLISSLPEDGHLIYNPQDPSLSSLLKYAKCPSTPYPPTPTYKPNLIGAHNLQNVAAAETLARVLNINEQIIEKSVCSFKGVARRLEIKYQSDKAIIVDDYAQSPQRLKAALNAIKETFPDKPLYVYFEPHASFLKTKVGLEGLEDACQPASEVIISKLNFDPKIPATTRSTFADYRDQIGKKCRYLPLNQDLLDYFSKLPTPYILAHFSSGGLTGLRNLDQIIVQLSQ